MHKNQHYASRSCTPWSAWVKKASAPWRCFFGARAFILAGGRGPRRELKLRPRGVTNLQTAANGLGCPGGIYDVTETFGDFRVSVQSGACWCAARYSCNTNLFEGPPELTRKPFRKVRFGHFYGQVCVCRYPCPRKVRSLTKVESNGRSNWNEKGLAVFS